MPGVGADLVTKEGVEWVLCCSEDLCVGVSNIHSYGSSDVIVIIFVGISTPTA